MAERKVDPKDQDDAVTAKARRAAELAVGAVVKDSTRAEQFASIYQTVRPLLLAHEIHPAELGEFGQALAAAAQLEYVLRQQLENSIETRRAYDPEGTGVDVSGQVVSQLIDAVRTAQTTAADMSQDSGNLAWRYLPLSRIDYDG